MYFETYPPSLSIFVAVVQVPSVLRWAWGAVDIEMQNTSLAPRVVLAL